MSKKKVVASLIVLAIISGVIWLAATRPSQFEIPAPAVGDGESPTVEAAASQIQIEFHVKLKALQDTLNAKAPKAFGDTIPDPTDALTEDNVTWNLALGEITLAPFNGTVAFSAPFTGNANLSGKFGVKKRNKGLLGWFESIFNTSFSETAHIGGVVRGTIRPTFNPDWTVNPNLTLNVDLSTAQAQLFGKAIRLSFRGELENRMREKVEAFVSDINTQLASDQTIRSQVARGWTALHLVTPVYESPAVWVMLTPDSIGASDPIVTADEVVVRVAASVRTAVQVSGDQPSALSADLPLLTPVTEEGGAFSMAVPIAVELKLFNNLSPEKLKIPSTFDTGSAKIKVERMFLLGDAGVLYVGAHIVAGTGWFDRIEGDIYLAGKPVLDADGKVLRIDDLRYDVRTSNYLVRSASYLLQPVILAELRKRAVFDISSAKSDLIATADIEVTKLKASLPTGVDLDFEVTKVGVSDLMVDNGWLVIVATAEGPATVHISGLDDVTASVTAPVASTDP